jgi:exopolysaccharide biosynthesis protein
MNIKYKLLSCIISTILLVTIASPVFASNNDNYIYENKTTNIITRGVLHTNIDRFTEDGWLNINIVEADLNENYIDLKLLTDNRGISYLEDVIDMSKTENTVASINGDFFQWKKGDTSRGNAIGPVIKDGNILSSTSDQKGMATALLTNENEMLFDYINFDIAITAPNGETNEVKYINKFDSLDSIVMYDKNWGEYSIGSYDNIVELVVENNKVTEIRREKEPVKIPENGYILCNLPEFDSFLIDNFEVGDEVELDVTSSINTDMIQYAFGAGTMLIKDGKPHEITHNISGLQPRTAIGTDITGKKVYLITIDGRQISSKGMTLDELSDFLIEQGIYNAVNLDGGGSTTMAVRELGNENIGVINSLSDGWLRNVTNTIAIVCNSPKSNLSNLIIEKSSTNVFENTSISFDVKGYDKYYNAVSIDISNVNWSCEGIEGYFKGNIFYPESVGSGYIVANVNGITAKTSIDVLSSPAIIELSSKKIILSKGDKIKLEVEGKNKNGYSAPIDANDVNFTIDNNIATIENGYLQANKSGSAVLTAKIGNVTSNCLLLVDVNTPVDEFESLNGSFLGYPSYITGSYEITNTTSKNGNYAGKLTYDFTVDKNDSKAAYIKFNNEGIYINENVNKIGMWVYASDYMEHWLRGMIKGPDNEPYRINFEGKIDWNGWKYVEAKIPDDIPKPMRLTRLYVVQIDPEIKNKGTLYFDDLTFVYSNNEVVDITLPKDIKYQDELNKEFVNSDYGFTFSVFGDTIKYNNLLENLIMSKAIYKLNKNSDMAGFVTDIDETTISDLEIPYFDTSGYMTFEKEGNTFIYLDDTNDGFRKTDNGQWSWFMNQIETIKTDNVFIFFTKPLEGNNGFTDIKEAKLFKDTLTNELAKKGKTVFVFYKGETTSFDIDRGVRYFSIPGIKATNPDDILNLVDEYNYILVSVDSNGNATYDIKNIFE